LGLKNGYWSLRFPTCAVSYNKLNYRFLNSEFFNVLNVNFYVHVALAYRRAPGGWVFMSPLVGETSARTSSAMTLSRFHFLELLGELSERFEVASPRVPAHGINHYHLLLETPEANLSRALRGLNGKATAVWF
jgi:hypothetical protein